MRLMTWRASISSYDMAAIELLMGLTGGGDGAARARAPAPVAGKRSRKSKPAQAAGTWPGAGGGAVEEAPLGKRSRQAGTHEVGPGTHCLHVISRHLIPRFLFRLHPMMWRALSTWPLHEAAAAPAGAFSFPPLAPQPAFGGVFGGSFHGAGGRASFNGGGGRGRRLHSFTSRLNLNCFCHSIHT